MRTLLCALVVAMSASAFAEPPIGSRPDPLDAKITLPAGKDSFQRRLDFIAKETGVKIAVDGASLQRLGITRHQITVVAVETATAPAIDHLVALCRQIENHADHKVEVRRAADGSVAIAAQGSP